MTARAELERAIDIAQSSHVDRGFGWERIVTRGDQCVYVEAIVPINHRIPFGDIRRAALITPFEWEEH